MQGRFTAVYEKHGRWYVAYVEEIPGVNTQGRTMKEARSNLRDALRIILETNHRLAARRRGASVRREPLILGESA